MTPRTRIPISLCIVAVLFIVSGVHGVFQTIEKWRAGILWIPLDALCLPVGIGLLRRRRVWRTCALWLIGFGLVVLIPFVVWLLVSRQFADVPAVLYLVAFIASAIWSLYVLTRRDVVAVYAPNAA